MRCVIYLNTLVLVLAVQPGLAASDKELEELRNDVRVLTERLKRLEARQKTFPLTKAPLKLGPVDNEPPAVATTKPVVKTLPQSKPFEMGVSMLFSAGGSTVNDAALSNLQPGGHDPRRNGFTVQNLELSMSGAIDAYFNGQVNLIFNIDSEGATVVELEEAFLSTRALPYGLQVKAGQYFTEFGRHNPQHPHSWSFVDQPVVLSRLFGADGLRSQGVRLGWLAPLPWYSEFFIGVQNAGGETLSSFLWNPAEQVGGYTLINRGGARSASDLLWSGRWFNGVDFSPTVSANFAASILVGPNASGTNTNTRITGIDLYLKWRPVVNARGFPYVAWQTEWLKRNYETPGATLEDQGVYTQLLWGFRPRWVAGFRAEYADGNANSSADPLRDQRERYSANLSFYPTEYSKIRLQYNHDRAEHLPGRNADSVWLQFEYNFGAHAAHKF